MINHIWKCSLLYITIITGQGAGLSREPVKQYCYTRRVTLLLFGLTCRSRPVPKLDQKTFPYRLYFQRTVLAFERRPGIDLVRVWFIVQLNTCPVKRESEPAWCCLPIRFICIWSAISCNPPELSVKHIKHLYNIFVFKYQIKLPCNCLQLFIKYLISKTVGK